MFKIEKRKVCVSLVSVLIVSSVIAFSATNSFAQKSGKGRYLAIPLIKGAKNNGYKIYQRGRHEINFTATGVVNPTTREKLQGKRNLEFKCGDQVLVVGVMSFGGVSNYHG